VFPLPDPVLPLESRETITTSFLCYPLLLASGLAVFFFKENQKRFVRFHAWQSILFSATATILLLLSGLLTSLTSPKILPAFVVAVAADSILGFLSLAGWLVLMYTAWQGLYFKLPLFGTFADRLATDKQLYNVQQTSTVPGTTNLTIITENDKFTATMSYPLFFISGLITYFLGKNNRFIRFHALQSILFFVIILLVGLIALLCFTAPILVTPGIIISVILLTFLIAGWVLGMYHAFKGHYYKMPFIGSFVENIIKQDASLI
jgi:uncharacterized membrane protein